MQVQEEIDQKKEFDEQLKKEAEEKTDNLNRIASSSIEYKKKKFKALYQARTVLSKIGNMAERSSAKKQLNIMRKKGIKSV